MLSKSFPMSKKMKPFHFYRKFSCENDCLQLLFNIKWKNGYQCRKCGSKKCLKGRTEFHLRCGHCSYDESPIINTAFQRLKMPLLKAFHISRTIIKAKNGVSDISLAEEYGLDPRTVSAFRNRLHLAMNKDLEKDDSAKMVSPPHYIDSINISQRGHGLNGFQTVQVYFAEWQTNDGWKMKICTSCFLPDEKELTFSELRKGKYIRNWPSIQLWNFKQWFTGTHHQSSMERLKGHLDEFCFRLNHRKGINQAFDRLMTLMMQPQSHAGQGNEGVLHHRSPDRDVDLGKMGVLDRAA